MIPPTPLLLVQAAHTLARHAPRLVRQHPALPCSLDFVLAIGDTVQRDVGSSRTSWPVTPVQSVDELRQQAMRRGWMRASVVSGDLLLFRDWSADGTPSVGVVLAVLDYGLTVGSGFQHCWLAVARAEGTHGMRVHMERHWCSAASGDQGIRWFAPHGDVERAA